eukprot:CAMPEP_0113943000 /NCGR_PEP_ID=MMETSP1339-20121228/15208_1 /TAXON_ID=94617 /ORGANISM="Fibrocapsa japonica" /LENGTH=254 /DNA_ID=CAMNT_0000947723 /DNA_START=65 /DNA_END=829 /DNA_ORIENTATION=+ /assembly_acc=CAM_ASM_000762
MAIMEKIQQPQIKLVICCLLIFPLVHGFRSSLSPLKSHHAVTIRSRSTQFFMASAEAPSEVSSEEEEIQPPSSFSTRTDEEIFTEDEAMEDKVKEAFADYDLEYDNEKLPDAWDEVDYESMTMLPTNNKGQSMSRVIVVGSDQGAYDMVKAIHDNERVTGLYLSPTVETEVPQEVEDLCSAVVKCQEHTPFELAAMTEWLSANIVMVADDRYESEFLGDLKEKLSENEDVKLVQPQSTKEILGGKMEVFESLLD